MKIRITRNEIWPIYVESKSCGHELEITEEDYANWKKAEHDFYAWQEKLNNFYQRGKHEETGDYESNLEAT